MLPVGEWLRWPYDQEACYAKKRDFDWVGYKVHVTETCHVELPHFSTQVQTVQAIQQDPPVLDTLPAKLALSDLLPAQHLVEAGYISLSYPHHALARDC